MEYKQTKISLDELGVFLGKTEGQSFFDLSIQEQALFCEFEDHPSFFYFELENGKKYVLERISETTLATVYEVLKVDLSKEKPCEYILRDTVHIWDGDVYENLALYRLDVEPECAEEDDVDVMIWIAFHYRLEASDVPIDKYLTNLDFDPKSYNDAICDDVFAVESDAYEPHLFPTYQDACKWIETQEKATYHLAYNEVERPTYTIVP